MGGGYPAHADASKELWRFSLAWMLGEAQAEGLRVDEAARSRLLHVEPDPDAPRHKSLAGWWKLAELLPKKVGVRRPDGSWRDGWRANLFKARSPRTGDRVHWSAACRKGYAGRVPDATLEE